MKIGLLLTGCCVGLACASQSSNSVSETQTQLPAIAQTALEPPKLRLGDAVLPVRYAVELRVDPRQEPFTGTVDIDVTVRDPVRVIWLNADGLVVDKAAAQVGGQNFSARVVAVPRDFVGIAFDQPLPAGGAHLRLEYSGKLGSKEVSGPTRQQENGEWYAFTHFEPIDARRAYPCVDEPSFKVPWQFTLDVPVADQAYANAPLVSEYEAGDGFKQVKFEVTQPLPSYLTAWAVGPIEAVDAGKTSLSGTPVRVLAARGHFGEAAWAVESSAPILGELEGYLLSGYPYQKLDVIAVPQFRGAMENPGLVTFAQRALLQKPEETTVARRRGYAHVAAHEFAHQWFGDWVTTAWWDDLWLNEAFATWMDLNIVETWQPKWGVAEDRIGVRARAMEADSLLSARKIRQPIESNDDIKNAFDGITYSKGASVIRMFEQWIGADVFRAGVQRYFREHQGGNATSAQFLAAISAEAGRDIAPPFSTFLDQSGVPIVSVEMKCEKGQPASVHLSQHRYLPAGAEASPEAAQQLWQIPVKVRWGSGKTTSEASTLLTTREGDLSLQGLVGCPDWLLPNASGAGYYRSQLSPPWQAKLLKDGNKLLTVPERLGAISDWVALVRSGAVPYAELLAIVPALSKDTNRHILGAAIDVVSGLRDGRLVSAPQQPALGKLIRDSFGRQARTLGWQARANEDEDTALLRRALVPLVADQGEDASLVADAKKLAAAWLANHTSVDQAMIDDALAIAAKAGDRALFESWHQAALHETDRFTRRHLLGAMSAFRDPEIVKTALALTLTDEFDVRDSIELVWGATRVPETALLAHEFIKAHFDALVARLPRDSGAAFPNAGAAACDPEHEADVKDFFAVRAKQFVGGPRLLNQALEKMRLCVALRKTQGPSVDQFFKTLGTSSKRNSTTARAAP